MRSKFIKIGLASSLMVSGLSAMGSGNVFAESTGSTGSIGSIVIKKDLNAQLENEKMVYEGIRKVIGTKTVTLNSKNAELVRTKNNLKSTVKLKTLTVKRTVMLKGKIKKLDNEIRVLNTQLKKKSDRKLLIKKSVLVKQKDALSKTLAKDTRALGILKGKEASLGYSVKILDKEIESVKLELGKLNRDLIACEDKINVIKDLIEKESDDISGDVISGGKIVLTASEQRLDSFIRENLLTDDGLIRTDITDRSNEYLSESITLWLSYLVMIGDEVEFSRAVDALEVNFIHDEGHIGWVKNGDSLSTVNAWIDDARAIRVLDTAYKKFGDDRYDVIARELATDLVKTNLKNDYFVDMYDSMYDYANDDFTVLFSDVYVMDYMLDNGLITKDVHENMVTVVLDTPMKNGLYGKTFSTVSKEYTFDDSTSLLDQAYVAMISDRLGADTSEFAKTVKSLYDRDGVLYARYSPEDLSATVNFESIAGYGLLSMYFDSVGDGEFAKVLLDRMKEFRAGESSVYYGGHIYDESKQTHSFDNLISLISEIMVTHRDN